MADGSSNKRVRQEANSVLPYGHPISEPHIPRYEVARRRIAFMPDSSPDPGHTIVSCGVHISNFRPITYTFFLLPFVHISQGDRWVTRSLQLDRG